MEQGEIPRSIFSYTPDSIDASSGWDRQGGFCC